MFHKTHGLSDFQNTISNKKKRSKSLNLLNLKTKKICLKACLFHCMGVFDSWKLDLVNSLTTTVWLQSLLQMIILIRSAIAVLSNILVKAESSSELLS